MKWLVLIVLFLFTSGVFSQERTKLAILGFLNKGDKSDDYYNSMISGSLSSFLSKLKELKVLSYSEVSKVVSNKGLLDKKELDFNLAVDTGVILGASQVLIGDYIVNKKAKEININFYVYDVKTGDLRLKRSYTGKTDMDFFDTMDRIISIVGSLILARPLFLGKLFVEIDSDGEYLLYINDSFQKKVSKRESFSDSVLAEESFVLSLKESKGMKEVYRGEILLKSEERYYFKYIPSGMVKINGKGFEGGEIYTNEIFYNILSKNGETIISNIRAGTEYSVYLKKGDILTEKKLVKIEEGQTKEINFKIENLRKTKIPLEDKSTISVWNISGYVMCGLGVISIGTGYYFNLEARRYYDLAVQKYDEYKNATSDVETKKKYFEDVFNNLNTSILARNISYIGGGVLLSAGLILSFLPFKSENRSVSFEVSPEYVGVNYRFEF